MANKKTKTKKLECTQDEWETLAYIISMSLLDTEDMLYNERDLSAEDEVALEEGAKIVKNILAKMAPIETPWLTIAAEAGQETYPIFSTDQSKYH